MVKPKSQIQQSTLNIRSWKQILRVPPLVVALSLLFLTLGVNGAFASFDIGDFTDPLSGVSDGSEASKLQFPGGASVDDAAFVRQTVPPRMVTSQTKTVSITLRNTGTTIWTRAGGYKLGTQNPRDNRTWTGGTRIYLKPGETVAPGQTTTFTFDITAPMDPGIHDFQWRMVRENVHWFGAYTRNVPIRVRAPQDRAQFVSQSVPRTRNPGQTAIVSVTMRNTGTTTWTRAEGYKLGSQNPQDNDIWTGSTRVYLKPGESIAPGQSKTFRFKITAPMAPGFHDFQWRMVREDVHWFGAYTRNVPIRVKAPLDRAKFVSQSVPTIMESGQTATVSITMRNTGMTTWTRAGGYKLGSQNPQDNKIWTSGTRIYLKPGESIAPGQSKTFTFDITAPMMVGIRDFQWRMVHEDVQWFGERTENVRISIGQGPTPTPTPRIQPFPVRPGLWPGSAEETSVNDLDGDGLSQKFELQLAQWFFPTIWFDNGEDCTAPGGAPGHFFNLPGRLIFRVRPHPNNPDYIAMSFALLYQDDCGVFQGMGSHPGDVEPFAITLAPNPACPLGYGAYALTTWAHYGTSHEVKGNRKLYNRCRFGFSRDPLGHGDVVMVAENKHGNYKSDRACDEAAYGTENCDFDFTLGNVNAWIGFNVGEEWPPSQRRHHDLGPLGFHGERLWERKDFCGKSDKTGDCPGPAEEKMYLVADKVVPQAYVAEFISQSGVPGLMQTGERALVSITMKNKGLLPWTRQDGYQLGAMYPTNPFWVDWNRVNLEPSDVIEPGQRKKFIFEITAPSTPGIYNFQWGMVRQGYYWFAEFTPNSVIFVTDSVTPTPSANDAAFISQSVPSKLEVGETAAVSITLQNSGSTTWLRSAGFKLGSQNPQDNTIWTGDTRVLLTLADSIQPGQIKTFTFSIKAPDVPGLYDFQWRMIKESEAWFGDYTHNVLIMVTDSKIPSDTPQATSSPTPSPTPYQPPSATPTPTPWLSPTPTSRIPSSTPTPTPWVPSSTPSPTPFPSYSPTPTPTKVVPTSTFTPTRTPTPLPQIWEDDNFDNLALGALHGQNGWFNVDASGPSAIVVPDSSGRILQVDPPPGQTIIVEKNVPDQSNGRHVFSFRVKVSGASEASLAKIEVQTAAYTGWTKKFQIYFGSSMRVVHSPSNGTVYIVPATEMGRWYDIRCEIDFATEQLDVWMDGSLVAAGIPMHPGPLISLSISGWDRTGIVWLDDLLGFK